MYLRKDKEHFIYEIAIEVLEKNPYIVEDTLALIDSTLLLNLSEEEVRARAEKNKKEIRVVEDNLKKQKDVVPQVKKKMTSQEKDNEKVKQVIANARKEVKPMVVYEPVSNVVAKSELTAKDRARARKALKEIRAEYFAKNKSQKLKNNETLIVKTSNEGIETKKYSNAEIQKVLKEIRANYKK